MVDEQRVKVFVHPIVLTEHVFDKVRSIDMTLAEFNALLTAHGVVIEETVLGVGQVWLTMETAIQLDEIFNRLLASGAEMAQTHWESAVAA